MCMAVTACMLVGSTEPPINTPLSARSTSFGTVHTAACAAQLPAAMGSAPAAAVLVGAGTLSYVLLVYYVYYGIPSQIIHSPWHQQHKQASPTQTPALAVFHSASASVSARSLAQQQASKTKKGQQCCQAPSDSMHSALAAQLFRKASAAAALHGPGDDPAHIARQAVLRFRADLGRQWYASFRPIVETNQHNSSSSCRCQAVQLLPAQAHSTLPGASTAILLVVDSWSRLEQQLQLYSANLLMLWFYARLHGYGLHIYVHGAELPPWMPVYFIKPAGLLHAMNDLGYQHVMYTDWDVLLSPHTAPPLALFYGEYPAASLLLQGEYNFAAGANLWRNTPEGQALLQAWWDLGARGCCPTTQHDQTALKHLALSYLADVSGDASVYGPKARATFKLPASLPPPACEHPAAGEQFAALSTEPPSVVVSKWLQLQPRLKARDSAVGLIGLDVHYVKHSGQRTSTVAFHSCMGLWWGCVPPETPALLYHVGGVDMRKLTKTGLAQRMVTHLGDWFSLAGLLANVSAVR